jgi:hypothetical protein
MSNSGVLHHHVSRSDDPTHADEPLDPAPGPDLATPGRRSTRRAVRMFLAAIALSLGGVALHGAGDSATDGPQAVECSQPGSATASTDPACDGLWDRVRALGLPENEWAAAAEAMGLFPRGGWISDDGLRWEHLDGRSYVVATPQRTDDRQPSGS